MDEYIEVNRANWDARVPHHLGGYDLDSFRSDPSFISHVVNFDQVRLGSVAGLDVVHLQCHIGNRHPLVVAPRCPERHRAGFLGARPGRREGIGA